MTFAPSLSRDGISLAATGSQISAKQNDDIELVELGLFGTQLEWLRTFLWRNHNDGLVDISDKARLDAIAYRLKMTTRLERRSLVLSVSFLAFARQEKALLET